MAYTMNTNTEPTSTVYTRTHESAQITYLTFTPLPPITVGHLPTDIKITPDKQKAIVVNLGSNNVTVFELATKQILSTIQVGGCPLTLAFSPSTSMAYVINSTDSTMTPIDLQNYTAKPPINTGYAPRCLAIDPIKNVAYTVNDGIITPHNEEIGYIIPVNLSSGHQENRIDLGYGLADIAITSTYSMAYVPSYEDNTVIPIDLRTLKVLAPFR